MSIAHHAEETAKAREGLGGMLRRVKIRNYKSIKNCDVELGPFTILVGRNGAGKSNFVGALRLVADGLRDSLGHVAKMGWPWGGRGEGSVLYDVEIELTMSLPTGEEAVYGVTLAAGQYQPIEVRSEALAIREAGRLKVAYRREDDRISGDRVVAPSIAIPPSPSRDRLYLARISDLPEFRPLYDALTAMAFYNLNPGAMRSPQLDLPSTLLEADGSNLTAAFDALRRRDRWEVKDRIVSYLKLVVPEFRDVAVEKFGSYSTLAFHQRWPDTPATMAHKVRSFTAAGVSDGTLRALGILVAINQLASDGRPIRLVGIEEPETALHPAAAGVLMDALREASTHTQVLVTTHSADLLDRYDPDEDHLLAVESRDGRTEIGPVDRASREVIRKHLYSAGELLRMDQIEVDREAISRQESSHTLDTQAGETR